LEDSGNNGDPSSDSTEDNKYFDNLTTLTYDIATRYDVKKQNN
jgi:hypothetical protein